MKTDIVDALRGWSHGEDYPGPALIDILDDAANEIERLRKEIAIMREIAAAEDEIFNKLVSSR